MNHKPHTFNIIFCSQGSALNIFDQLLPDLDKFLSLDKVGIFVADQLYWQNYTKATNNLSKFNVSWLKEWEINTQAKHVKPNLAQLEALEEKYGTPHLWPALIADRRISLGPSTKYKQDYAPRLSHTQMLALLQVSIGQIEQFIDLIKPHAIVGFNMVTIHEFLIYLIAKRNQIPYWQIKNAKIANYVTLFPDPLHISSHLKQQGISKPTPAIQEKAKQYLSSAQSKNSTYEGHVILKPPSLSSIITAQLLKKLFVSTTYSLIKPFRHADDTQSSGLTATLNFNVAKPLKAINHHHFLSSFYLSPQQLPHIKYVFFPLHTEPEIALSIYGRYFQNQIEVIRNIAQSIPSTWRVVVKDHPRSLGLRKLQYYKKLLQIPNVRLINPYVPSYDVIEHAQAITTITSWVGFEAVMSKKPVVTLGECTYNALPDTMVVKNKSYQELPSDITSAISNYHYDEQAVLDHIATVISLSHPINMYSEVLAKPNRHTTTADLPSDPWPSFAKYIAGFIQRNS